MTVTTALTQLYGLRIQGAAAHYDPRALPDLLTPDKLPALITTFDDSFTDVYRPIGFDFSGGQFAVYALQRICIDYAGASDPARMSELPTWIDRYATMISGNWLLADAQGDEDLLSPLYVEMMRVGMTDWNGELFIGLQFRLRLLIRLN